jgi:hypothetical protein
MLGRSSATGLAAAVAIVSLAGCGSDAVHDQWKQRTSLPACGTLTLEQGSSLEKEDGRELACLNAAFRTGKAAELRVARFTQEGDPVTEYYRVTDEGTTEVYVDSSKDPNSDEKWSFNSCDNPKSAVDSC